MKKYAIPALSLILGFFLGGLTLYILSQRVSAPQDTDSIPAAVEQKYQEIEAEAGNSFGATLSRCDSNQGKIYIVSGSGGFTSIKHYYGNSGDYLGYTQLSDVVDDPENKLDPPAEVDTDSCKLLLPKTATQNS